MLTSILLPTMNRHDLLMQALQSLYDTTQGHEIECVIMVDGDKQSDVDAWKFVREHWKQGIVSYSPTPRGAIYCWNLALKLSHGDHIFCAGDDALYHPDWLTHAKNALDKMGGNACVGLNDLLNAKQDFSTTFYFDRQFVKEHLGGVVAVPLYHYYCVDNEITERARRANRWVYCAESIVEHRHPAAGKREVDDTDRSHMDTWTHDVDLLDVRRSAGFPNNFESVI